jgi:hypothetical protein
MKQKVFSPQWTFLKSKNVVLFARIDLDIVVTKKSCNKKNKILKPYFKKHLPW